MKKKNSIKWECPRGESNPGTWVDRQVSNPIDFKGYTKWMAKDKNISKCSKTSKA